MIVDLTPQIIADKENKTLNKPFRTPKGPKKFSVYVKNDKGNIVKVNFGDPNMEIKRDDPDRRKSFRARHNCDNPGPKWKARYWSCRQWRAGKRVEGSEIEYEWDGNVIFDHDKLLKINPALALGPAPQSNNFWIDSGIIPSLSRVFLTKLTAYSITLSATGIFRIKS